MYRRFEPILLLLLSGLGIGTIFPSSRIAQDLGLPPLLFAASVGLLASFEILIVARIMPRGASVPLKRLISYGTVAGALTFAPFGLVALAARHIGASIPALFQSLVPAATVLVVVTVTRRIPDMRTLAALVLGLAGTVIIVFFRFATLAQPPLGWVAVALAVPLLLAAGNVFRSRYWPAGATSEQLAGPTLLLACLILLLCHSALGEVLPDTEVWLAGLPVIVCQGLLTGAGYLFFFRLQRIGGPVYLSQVSYVNSAVGAGIAMLLLGERINAGVLAGALIVVASIFLSRGPTRSGGR